MRDKDGKVLVVKEDQDTWSLPGGGLHHGEQPQEGILRELKEELGVNGAVIKDVIYTATYKHPNGQIWVVWIVFDTTIDSTKFIFGKGVTDAQFIDVETLKSSNDVYEQHVYQAAKALI